MWISLNVSSFIVIHIHENFRVTVTCEEEAHGQMSETQLTASLDTLPSPGLEFCSESVIPANIDWSLRTVTAGEVLPV